ncbi:MAG: excisionase family DNA-binding protein [Anaerolineae bacterium]
MENLGEGEWLSLQEAARRLGVHSGTLRRWADEGRVPFMLTAGGHRRFSRTALREFLRGQLRSAGLPRLGEVWAARAMVDARREIGAHQGERWVAAYGEEDRQTARELGRRLMGILLQAISQPDVTDDLRQEARAIGAAYAQHSRRLGIDMSDVLKATFFFRDRLLETAVTSAEDARGRRTDTTELVRRINDLVNVIQLAAIEVYRGT